MISEVTPVLWAAFIRIWHCLWGQRMIARDEHAGKERGIAFDDFKAIPLKVDPA
jgi:hypothetical protein